MLTDIRGLADHFLIALPNINNSSIDSYIVPLSCIGQAEQHYYRGVIAMFLIFLDNITVHGRSPVSQ